MEISIKRKNSKFQFEATNTEKASVLIAAGQKLDSEAEGLRPMQLLLVSLGTCMAIDVLNLLYKQRQNVEDFRIKVSGKRRDAIPSIFKSILIELYVDGKVKKEKLEHAIHLSETKYCSVHHMLSPPAEVLTKYYLNHEK